MAAGPEGAAWFADGEAATGVGWRGGESGGEAREKQGGGARRGARSRGSAGRTWPRGGSAGLSPAARGHERGGGGRRSAPGARLGRAGRLGVLRAPSLTRPRRRRSEANSAVGSRSPISPAWARDARRRVRTGRPSPARAAAERRGGPGTRTAAAG